MRERNPFDEMRDRSRSQQLGTMLHVKLNREFPGLAHNGEKPERLQLEVHAKGKDDTWHRIPPWPRRQFLDKEDADRVREFLESKGEVRIYNVWHGPTTGQQQNGGQ